MAPDGRSETHSTTGEAARQGVAKALTSSPNPSPLPSEERQEKGREHGLPQIALFLGWLLPSPAAERSWRSKRESPKGKIAEGVEGKGGEG